MSISGSILQQFIATIAGGLLLLMTQQALAAEEAAITAPVNELHSVLLKNMKQAATEDFSRRYERLKPVIAANFNTALISKVILGRFWRDMDKQAQTDFIDLFERLTLSTYANRFNDYDNHRFSTVAVEELRNERHLVKTELQAEGEEPVALDYIVQASEDGWKIISVIANGVNDLSLKRAEYGTVIKNKGYNSLVEDIRMQLQELLKG